MKTFKNILVVRTDRIGDVVLTTPAIAALRKAYPDARICVLVSQGTKDLVEGNPYVDKVLVDDRKKCHRGFWGFLKLVRFVRRQRFDLAIVYHTKRRTNLLCFLAGIPHRLGYQNNKYGFFLTEKIPDMRALGLKHEVYYCLDLLRHLGVKAASEDIFIPVQPEAEDWAEQLFLQYELKVSPMIIAIHPGASCPTRKWPVGRFADLMTQLKEKYKCTLLIIGASDCQKTIEEIRFLTDVSIVDLTGKTTLAQLISILKRCALLISNDSGPVHVADGLGTPTISIFTRNQPGINPDRWRPLSSKSRVVVTPFRGELSFAKHVSLDDAYLELISVQDVLQAVDDVFKLC